MQLELDRRLLKQIKYVNKLQRDCFGIPEREEIWNEFPAMFSVDCLFAVYLLLLWNMKNCSE